MIRRIRLAGVSLLFSGVVLGCLFCTSARLRNRFQPLPAFARLVCDRVDSNRLLSFFPLPDAIPRQLFKILNKQCRCLESCPMTIATASNGGSSLRDEWIVVSELGGWQALVLRWKLILFPPGGIEFVRPYAAWPVWSFDDPQLPSWASVRFVVTDGLLICSISGESYDIYYLIDTLDKRAASLADRRAL